jgi:hypothetical protein
MTPRTRATDFLVQGLGKLLHLGGKFSQAVTNSQIIEQGTLAADGAVSGISVFSQRLQ